MLIKGSARREEAACQRVISSARAWLTAPRSPAFHPLTARSYLSQAPDRILQPLSERRLSVVARQDRVLGWGRPTPGPGARSCLH